MKIGLVYNWPGYRNAEFDLIGRIRQVLTRLGHDSVVIDPFGRPIEPDTATLTGETVSPRSDLDFALYLHYLNPKLLDTFSYIVNWNPLRYLMFEPSTGTPLDAKALDFIRTSLISHDYVLSASSKTVDDFVSARFVRSPWAPQQGPLKLHTSCQQFPDMPPVRLDDFKVFYIGINWERIAKARDPNVQARHEGLMERLDATGDFVFYGVRQQDGVDLWEGFSNYRGELPFDAGASLVETCNRHGVALVLSSDAHRESALVSMRIFQACAARAVIVAENNPFIVEQFGDTVLIFDYEDDTERTAANIREQVAWIRQHPSEAQTKAEAAHRIFVERFSLEVEIGQILDAHAANLTRHAERWKRAVHAEVDVYFLCSPTQLTAIEAFFEQVGRQHYVQVRAVLVIDEAYATEANAVATRLRRVQLGLVHEVLVLKGVNHVPRGEAFRRAFAQLDNAAFLAFWHPGAYWHVTHLANLVTACAEGYLAAQTAAYVTNDAAVMRSSDVYTALCGSIDTARRLDEFAIVTADVSRVESASLLFHRDLVPTQGPGLDQLGLLDSHLPFVMLTEAILSGRGLPAYVPRFTCQHTMRPSAVDTDRVQAGAEAFCLTWHDGQGPFSAAQQAAFLREAYGSNPAYFDALSLARRSRTSVEDELILGSFVRLPDGNLHFSLNKHMRTVLQGRPWLLRTWERLFKLVARILK